MTEDGFEMPLAQLISLGSDGPNVKTIWKAVQSHLKTAELPGLITFVPCSLHTVHNSFRKGLHVYGENAEQLAIDIFQWFKTHICQREDLQPYSKFRFTAMVKEKASHVLTTHCVLNCI